jgi:hypothetical protein
MENLLRYINICTMPQDKLTKSKWVLFDKYYDSIVKIFRMHWYRNVFIELLAEKWIIDSPMLIYSPWRVEQSMTNRMIEEWLYANKTWHIFYDPTLFKSETRPEFDKIYMSIKLPDLLVSAMLSNTIPELCDIIKPFLSYTDTCKSSENESTTESGELEKAK